jgi:hypothetical protein
MRAGVGRDGTEPSAEIQIAGHSERRREGDRGTEAELGADGCGGQPGERQVLWVLSPLQL